MKIELTNHAKYRCLERGIDISDLKSVIDNPVKAINVGEGSLRKKKKLENGKILEVVYKNINKDKFLIVTAYYEN